MKNKFWALLLTGTMAFGSFTALAPREEAKAAIAFLYDKTNPNSMLTLKKTKEIFIGQSKLDVDYSIGGRTSGIKGSWKSSNKTAATVSQDGVVTAKKPGTTVISFSYKVNKKLITIKCKIIVNSGVDSLAIAGTGKFDGTMRTDSIIQFKATAKAGNNEVKINQETGTLIRDGVKSIMNPDDKNALESALQLKDKYGASVAVLSMGPPQAKEILKEALSMGADEVFLISDRKFGGSDTWATATIIASAIEKIGDYDIILCGRQAIDGDTAQVGPEIAEFLDIAQITYVKEIELDGDVLKVKRFTENGDYTYEVKTPVLLTAIKELNTPRYPTVRGIIENYGDDSESKINVISFEDLKVDESQIGLKGSPTNVYKSFVPVKSKSSQIIEGQTVKEITDKLIMKLSEVNLV